MKVPYRLRRIPEARPALALLVPGQDSGVLVRLCARLRLEPSPRIFTVADGFLLRLVRPLREPVAGVIRLGELAANLLLPVDAELVPALLADEAAALGRQRGMIFLPEGRILEFAPDNPIALSALLGVQSLRRNIWQTLPDPPVIADRITEIILLRPDDTPDAIIETGGAGIGEENPRPDDASLPKKILGKSAMSLGQGLAWLGKMLHLKGLAGLGGKLMAGGLSLVPRLSEKLMGKQEAGLRELLEEFRKGNVDQALRRALPLGSDPARGASPHQSSQLPTHNLGYSLGNILGGWGPASLWFTPDELYRELEREYRKQAEAAVKRGDYRRAAFIYGKLLSDYAKAAAVLAQGGLHHDAAIIYLKRLQDFFAAAREFEAAGEIDQALQLYRQRGEHVRAGDLLRRAGEEDLALAEYKHAADVLIQNGQGHYQAGELMLTRAERPDLARNYFSAGWKLRPAGTPVPCALRLAQLFADSGDTQPLLQLTEETQEFFQSPGNETPAADFCNEIARLAERPVLTPIREVLRDRSLTTLAHKLRQGGGQGGGLLVSKLFGPGTVWETPLVNDAHIAARSTRGSYVPAVAESQVTTTVIQGLIPIVRAVCQAPDSGEIFLGYESGEIACFDPSRGDVHFLDVHTGPVYGLAVNPKGNSLVTLSAGKDSPNHQLSCYFRTGPWQLVESQYLEFPDYFWLCPLLAGRRGLFVGLNDGSDSEIRILRLPRLLPKSSLFMKGSYPQTGLLLPSFNKNWNGQSLALLLFDGREMSYYSSALGEAKTPRRVLCGFPHQMASSSLDTTPVSWLCKGPEQLEIAGVGAEGALSWFDLDFQDGDLIGTKSNSSAGPFLAATLVRAGLIAAVTVNGIAWLRAGTGGIREQLRQPLSLPNAVACYPNFRTQELVVVSTNGSVMRIRQPV